MQYVNDDMDELFRRAAKDYPLDTSTGDWNKVAAALVNPEGTPAPETKKRSFLWLVMLVPFSMICHLYLQPGNIILKDHGKGIFHASTSVNPAPVAATEKANSNNSIDNNLVVAKSSSPVSITGVSHHTVSRSSYSNNSKQTNQNFSSTDQNVPGALNDVGANADNDVATTRHPDLTIPVSQRNKWSLQPLNPFATSIVTTSLSENPSRLKQKRFYAGIMGGIDATTVKFQKVEDAGYDVGVMLGYELNKKWSIEGGFFLDKKFYYTKGEYFDKSKIAYMPANTWITEVEGNCSMYEIPLAVKFNITRNKKSSLFTTAGVSSYIMKNEDYSYVYYYATPGVYATHNKSYENSSTDLFSVITFSGGYTHRIGKSTDIRLEPYLKLPVSGMGFGSLPLISGGVHVGVTRKLF